MSNAKSAAAARGYTLSNCDNFVLYFPNCGGDSAGYAGWAYVGASKTWLNGYLDRRVTVHEEGHNYGLWHSHSNLCSGGGLEGASVRIDGGAAVTIDQYASARQENVLVDGSPVLASGAHTVTVSVKGTRNSASTGYVISVDRAVWTG